MRDKEIGGKFKGRRKIGEEKKTNKTNINGPDDDLLELKHYSINFLSKLFFLDHLVQLFSILSDLLPLSTSIYIYIYIFILVVIFY